MRKFYIGFAMVCLLACLGFAMFDKAGYAALWGVLAIWNRMTADELQ